MTGILPRRGPSAPGRVTGPARDEERIARLAEDAARLTQAVSDPAATVRVDGSAARVDLDLVVDHGTHLPAVAEAVRRRVTARVEAQTGLTVEAVTVSVVGLRLASEPPGRPPPGRDAAHDQAGEAT